MRKIRIFFTALLVVAMFSFSAAAAEQSLFIQEVPDSTNLSISEASLLLSKNNVPDTMIEEPEEFPLMLFAGVVIAISIAGSVVILIIYMRIKNRPEVTSAVRSAGTPVLRSLAPQHGGITVQLHQEPVQVGYDRAACRIVYQEGTPGVSFRHCQIHYRESVGMFVVNDLNSEYGTFTAGGQRIAPDSPKTLPPGSVIYLGEEENAISLELSNAVQ